MYVKLEVLGGEKIKDIFEDMCHFTRNTGMNCGADINGTHVFCTLSDTPQNLNRKYEELRKIRLRKVSEK